MSARKEQKPVSFASFDEGTSFSNVRLNSQRQHTQKDPSPHRSYKYMRQYETQRENIAPNNSMSPVVAVKDIHTIQFLQQEVKRLEDVIFYVGTNNDKLLVQCDEQQKEIAYLKICNQRAREQFEAQLRKMKEIVADKVSECESVTNNAKRERQIMEQESERIKAQIKEVIEKKNNQLFRAEEEKNKTLKESRQDLERTIQELRDSQKEEIQNYRIKFERLEENLKNWKDKCSKLQKEYTQLEEQVKRDKQLVVEQHESRVNQLLQRYHKNKMLMLETSQREVETIQEGSQLQKNIYGFEIETLKKRIEILEYENRSTLQQGNLNKQSYTSALQEYETIIEELKLKLSAIYKMKEQQIEILKIKVGALHQENLRSVQDVYSPKLEFLSQKLASFQEEIDKLHEVLAKQLDKNSALVRKMRAKQSKHNEELIKMKMIYENAEQLLRQKFFTEKSMIMQQSAQAIKNYQMKANSLQFYEEELRKLRKQLDDQITSNEDMEQAFQEQRKLWEAEREQLLINNKNITQNAERTVRQLKGLIDYKSSEIDNLSKQILKSIRESPLPDYSKYVEEIENLKKDLLQKDEVIRNCKQKLQRSEKKCREYQEEFEKLNLQNDVIINEAKAEWDVLSQRRFDDLQEFYKKKVEFMDLQKQELNNINEQLQNKITQLVLKYKELQNGFSEMMASLQRRNELDQKVVLLGTDTNLIKNKQQLFEY